MEERKDAVSGQDVWRSDDRARRRPRTVQTPLAVNCGCGMGPRCRMACEAGVRGVVGLRGPRAAPGRPPRRPRAWCGSSPWSRCKCRGGGARARAASASGKFPRRSSSSWAPVPRLARSPCRLEERHFSHRHHGAPIWTQAVPFRASTVVNRVYPTTAHVGESAHMIRRGNGRNGRQGSGGGGLGLTSSQDVVIRLHIRGGGRLGRSLLCRLVA